MKDLNLNVQTGVLIAVLVNAFINQNWPSAVLVIVAGLIYAQERHEKALEVEAPAVDLTSIYSTIQMLETRLDKVVKSQDEMNKLATETKRLLSETNVGLAFRPRLAKKD